MTIDALVLKSGASAVGPTGGSDLAFSLIGGAKVGSALAAADADVSAISRRTLLFTATPAPASRSSVTGFGKQRRSVILKVPVEVSTGIWEDAIYELKSAEPVTQTSAEITENCFLAAQLLGNTSLLAFFTLGNQS